MSKRFLLDGRHVRQVLSLFIALVLVGSVSYLGERFYNSSHAATGASMSLNPASQKVTSGATISVTIRENSGTETVNAAQASLMYDANQLSYVSMSPGDFPFDAADSTSQSGVVRVARAIQTGTLSGDHAVATINFHVKSSSGSITISVDQPSSAVNRSSDGSNILAAVSGATYTVGTTSTPPPTSTPTPTPTPTQSPSATSATLSLSPSSGSYIKGSTINVAIHVKSSGNVTVAEPFIQYPTDQLSYVNVINNTSAFPTVVPVINKNGVLDISRGTASGGSGVSGDNLVATIQFKVIGDSGSAALKFTTSSGVYGNDPNNPNSILDLGHSQAATYTISSSPTGTPAPTSTPTPTQSGSSGGNTGTTASANKTSTVVTSSGGVVIHTQSGTGSVSQNGNSTQVEGSVDLAPVLASNTETTGDAVVKVEYYVGKKLLDTENKAPYTYKLDTHKFKNGSYTMTIKTYYESGTVDSRSDSLIVHNPVTFGYIMAHYTATIVGTLLALLILAFVFWQFLLPRFRGGNGGGYGDGGYGGYVGYAAPSAGGTGSSTAPEPTVIAPTVGGDSADVQPTQAAEQVVPTNPMSAGPVADTQPPVAPAPAPPQAPAPQVSDDNVNGAAPSGPSPTPPRTV